MRRRIRPSLARSLVASVIAVVSAAPVLPAARVHASETAAEKAAREIADAQDRAAEASNAYMEAQARLESLHAEEALNATKVQDLQSQVATLQTRLQQVALNRFTQPAGSESPILTGFASPEQQMQVAVYTQVVWDTADTAFDDYDSLNRDLLAQQRTLTALQQQTVAEQERLVQLRDRAIAEAESLKKIEAQRLKDEATRKALAAEQARRAQQVVARTTTRGGSDAVAVQVTPSAPVSSAYANRSWVCPTGPARVSFGHSFRPYATGNMQHNGIDMIGARGTPLLAVVNGTAQPRSNGPGGLVVFFYGDDGIFYYYAHLESYGSLGRVSKGTVIGYMGMTGNAGTYHLHFEMHPGGVGNPQDPYDKLAANCPS